MEWISVKDRCPLDFQDILISTEDYVESGCFRWKEYLDSRGDKIEDVTHWMPLPAPPKE